MSASEMIAMKLEVVVIPVADVEQAKAFYAGLGWRVDADLKGDDDVRVVQLTPPGSGCSVAFGTGVSRAEPGTAGPFELVVEDIDAARDALLAGGVERIDVFHGSPWSRLDGPDPDRRSYQTYGAFADPDGNEWLLQEVSAQPGGGPPHSTAPSSAG